MEAWHIFVLGVAVLVATGFLPSYEAILAGTRGNCYGCGSCGRLPSSAPQRDVLLADNSRSLCHTDTQNLRNLFLLVEKKVAGTKPDRSF